MKTVLILSLLCASSVFASVEVKTYGDRKEFEEFAISSTKNGAVEVKVDYKTIRVDCHGADYQYDVNTLKDESMLVTKNALMHTMNMCPPGVDHVITVGTKFKINFKESYGGSTTLLVPVGSEVTATAVK
jgi:hypothetical protein